MLFETKRILCRNFENKDFNDIHSYASDIRVVKYMTWGPNTIEQTKIFIKESIDSIFDEPRLKYELAIIDKEKNKFVGAIALYIVSEENGVGEIGYSINPKFWNNGYASEATKAMIKYSFKNLNLHRIQATCDIRNIASAKVLEKSYLKKEGKIRQHILLRDGWRDSYLYGILKREYKK